MSRKGRDSSVAFVGKVGRFSSYLNDCYCELREVAEVIGRMGVGRSKARTLHQHRACGDIPIRLTRHQNSLYEAPEDPETFAQQSSARSSRASSQNGVCGPLQLSRGFEVSSQNRLFRAAV